ncbi:DUF262 domain-containing HNH endonuclease family protein [Pedobacter nototheniae]|uniref:DUF262 domain-containing protein n=1 Tax=Pedobacter nototheniae TaxID=2488994 RepID=UPI00292E23EE|nr:DUF262 domain-containing HNH endonuclease family protein [Pedobacter nototheniae]
MQVKADVKSIVELKDYYFVVPDYQREYVWKADDQVEQFLIDIENEYNPVSDKQASYFIGSIIIVENENKFDVIDGQQRLTTIILSLIAFRDLLKSVKDELDYVGEEYLKSIEALLFSFDLKSKKKTIRLDLQYEESRGYLIKLIENESFEEMKTPSILKMESAHQKVKQYAQNLLIGSIDTLLHYVSYFLTQIELVVIKSENLSSALKIFETINQRGSGLNAMDLVKNLLFSQANEDDFQKIKNIWKEIIIHLQNCREDGNPLRFLRYFVIARYHNQIIREDEIYKWFISPEGKSALQYEKNPVRVASELNKMAKRYSDLVIATELVKDGGQYPCVTNIGFVNKYRSRQHLILLLALDEYAPIDVIEFLAKQLESFFFYSITLSIQAKYNENNFTKWAGKLRGRKTIDEIKLVVEEELIPYVTERLADFKNRFSTITHGHYSPTYRERYILGKIENTIRSKCNLPLQGNDFIGGLQIEHILPQTPKNDIIPVEFVDRSEYQNYVYRFGNTTLLEGMINQAVNNFNDMINGWFDKKQSEYANSDIISTKLIDKDFQIGAHTALNKFKSDYEFKFDVWDKKAIEKRQSLLLELIFESWTLNGKNLNKLN